MKKTIFIRHGRAEEPATGISDFERSLTLKGKTTARQMAHELKEKENVPGMIITSPAFRALETAYIFALEWGILPDKVVVDNTLYYRANLSSLLEILATADNSVDTIVFFGHNPSITEIADRLSDRGCEFLTKTSIVCLTFDVMTWEEVRPGKGRMEYFLKPEKQL